MNTEQQTKTCTKCGETKPLDCFHLGRGRLGGRSSCIDCRRSEAKEYREKNIEKIKSRYEENKHLHAAAGKAYREKNAERLKEKRHEYYIHNKEVIKRKVIDWRQNNPDRVDEYKKKSADKNLLKNRKARRDRYANEPDPRKRMRYHYTHCKEPEYLEKRAKNLRNIRAMLADSYVSYRLRGGSRKEYNFPNSLIELKRVQLKIHRATKQMHSTIKELTNEQ